MDEDLRHPSGGGSRKLLERVNDIENRVGALEEDAHPPTERSEAWNKLDERLSIIEEFLRAENLCRQCVDEAAARAARGKS